MTGDKSILEKGQMVNSIYEIQFFLYGNDYYQKYRVKAKDGKTYLLKLYNSAKLSIHSFAKNNLLEVEILALLNTSKTVKLVDNGEFVKDNQRYHYIVFEFISGETLYDKFKREGIFSQYSAVPLIIDLLEIVKEIHNHPKVVIHNNIDLKSIYLDYSGKIEKPVLTDFGFARYITSKSNSVNVKQLSPFYIAPELYNGIFTPQSDIFSVGALLYHLIVGLPPWYVEIPSFQHTEEKFLDAIHEKRNERLNFGIADSGELIDEHLKETIRKALAIDVDNRFKNAEEFIKALKREVVLEGGNKKQASTPKAFIKRGKGFSAIAGMQELKDILYNDVIRALTEKERFAKWEIPVPNGMLLYGPPGCGKTFISERFAEEIGFNFIKVIPSDIASIYVHGTQDKIGKIFKEAEENAPTIIFFDEIEAMVPNRSGDTRHSYSSEVNEFLAQMNNCGERGIFVIAATNRPEMIDTAFLRAGRVDYKIYVPPPDYEARRELFNIYLKNKPVEIDIDYDFLAKKTENYISADIKAIVDFAARKAEKEDVRISQTNLLSIIEQHEPSLSIVELNEYDQLIDKLSNKKNTFNDKPKIGF